MKNFCNLFAKQQLLNDYKARYLGVGTVDPNFHIFYEDEARDRSKD